MQKEIIFKTDVKQNFTKEYKEYIRENKIKSKYRIKINVNRFTGEGTLFLNN